jgi:hypothetical protein
MIRQFVLGFASALALVSAANAADLGSYKDVPSAWVSNDIIASNNQISVDFVSRAFAYKETNDASRIPSLPSGAPLDSETGWVPGVGVSASVMKNLIVSNLYLSLEWQHLDGKTDYKGSYQSCVTPGCYGTVTGKSGAVVNDLDGRIGKGFELGRSAMLTPYFGIGYHDWVRNPGYKEDYSNGYAGAGLLLQWSPINRLVLSANGFVGTTFGSNIDVTGAFSGALGDSAIYKAGFLADYAVTQHVHLNTGVEWQSFKYGESAIYGGGMFEPSDHQDYLTVKAGVGYAFGASQAPLK